MPRFVLMENKPVSTGIYILFIKIKFPNNIIISIHSSFLKILLSKYDPFNPFSWFPFTVFIFLSYLSICLSGGKGLGVVNLIWMFFISFDFFSFIISSCILLLNILWSRKQGWGLSSDWLNILRDFLLFVDFDHVTHYVMRHGPDRVKQAKPMGDA